MSIIAGFLGSGKTTLLNRLLEANQGIRYAVMVNDFGELNIDTALVSAHHGDTISFTNGCICCATGDNLVDSIDQLLAAEIPPHQFLVEASGVALPKPIADVATLHPGLQRDLIFTLADASTLAATVEDTRLVDTVIRQIEHADLLLLNKCDLASDTETTKALAWLNRHSNAPVHRTCNARIPPRLLADAACLLATPKETTNSETSSFALSNDHTGNDHTGHTQQFFSNTVSIHPAHTSDSVSALLQRHRQDILRAKGFVRKPDVDKQQVPEASEPRYDLIQYSNRVYCSDTTPPPVNYQQRLVLIALKDPVDLRVSLERAPD